LIPVDKWLVSGTDAQDETTVELFVERRRGSSDLRGGTFPDAYDTRADMQPISRGEHCHRRIKRVIKDSWHPDSAIAK
jgi:hypothetical protein